MLPGIHCPSDSCLKPIRLYVLPVLSIAVAAIIACSHRSWFLALVKQYIACLKS